MDIARGGHSADADAKYLTLSYATGLNEAWIAIRRSEIAFFLLPHLDRPMVGKVLTEFQNLAAFPQYTPILANVLAGTGAPYRDALLKMLTDAPEATRKQLSDVLFEIGIDAKVPGVVRRTDRPWD